MSAKPSLSSADVSADAQPGATAKAKGAAVTAIASDEQIAEFAASPQRWWGLLVLAVGLGMIVLDGTIVGVSLPTIISELGLDIVGAQ
nr:hypothetical protein [uncultured Corynebacterium sp.]